MKLKVLKQFHDKVTGECYTVGSIINPSDKRASEMLAAKGELVEKIASVENTEPKETVETSNVAKKPKAKK